MSDRHHLTRAQFLGISAALLIGGGITVADLLRIAAGTPPFSSPHLASALGQAVRPPLTKVERLMEQMSLEQKVAQLFIATPEQLTGGDSVTVADEALTQALAEIPVGGIAFFACNIADRAQLTGLLAQTAQLASTAGAGIAPFLSVDEEGGPLVARVANSGVIEGIPQVGSMASVGATGDANAAGDVGRTIGGYLRELGFNLDLAPVADVLTNPDNTTIGSRSFSSDPQVAAPMISSEVKAMLSTGVLPCVKHFPGHGDSTTDSHTGAAVTARTLDELRSCEFLPFSAAIDAGAPLIMTCHIQTPNATGNDLPATLSAEMIDGCLRGELGFDGVVVSDSFGMGAIDANFGLADACRMFLEAGGDMILMAPDLRGAYHSVLDAVAAGDLSEERIDTSVRRILYAKRLHGLL